VGEGSEGWEDEPSDGLEEFREEAQKRYQEREQPGEPQGGGAQKETEGSENESERPEPKGLDEFRQQIAAKYSEGDPP
jgi:hypothetical protein